ncbi:MAG: hypothetical protein AAGE43_05440 [Pseudomonadota bacterium]
MTMLLLAAAAAGAAEEAPPMPPPGFLEFLGAMVEADGELIDPMALESDLERVLAEEVRTAASEAVNSEAKNSEAMNSEADSPEVRR